MPGLTPGCPLADRCGAIHTDPLDHRDYGVTLMVSLPDLTAAVANVHSFPTALAAHEWAARQMLRALADVLPKDADKPDTITLPDGTERTCEDWLGNWVDSTETADHYGRPIVRWEVEWWTPNLPGLPVRAGAAGAGHVRDEALTGLTHTAYGLSFYDATGDMVGETGAVAYTEAHAREQAQEWIGRPATDLPADWLTRMDVSDDVVRSVGIDKGRVRFAEPGRESVTGCVVSPPVEWEETLGSVDVVTSWDRSDVVTSRDVAV